MAKRAQSKKLLCGVTALFVTAAFVNGLTVPKTSYLTQQAFFTEDRLFSPDTLSEELAAATKEALNSQRHVALASTNCANSDGDIRLVLPNQAAKMCWYANDYVRLLKRIPKHLRAVTFLVCDKDCKASDSSVLLVAKSREIVDTRRRTVTVVPVNVGRHFRDVARCLRDRVAYDDKVPSAIWRGASTSSCWENVLHQTNTTRNATMCSRWSLIVNWAHAKSGRVDVGLSRIVQLDDAVARTFKKFRKRNMGIDELLRYRYMISVEGNDVATNLKCALASNSVVLMPPPTRESFILEGNLIPWVHYVPLNTDTTDILEKIAYCETNVVHCKGIAKASTAWMSQFSTRRRIFDAGALVMKKHLQALEFL